MRQLRIKSTLCSIKNFNFTCEYDYSFSNEETNSFEIGWTNETTIKSNSTIQQAFQYQSSDQLDTYIYTGDHGRYSGGGYVYEFQGRLLDIQSNISELHKLGWIDRQTRAIIIQLSLYNPNIDLFTSVTFLIEFLSTGGAFPQSSFQPIDLHNEFQGFSSIVHSIFAIIYMLFITYFTCIEIHSLIKLKKKYFHSIWCFIQWGTIISSWAGLGIYIWRYFEGSHLSKFFQETNGYKYVNIQMDVDADEILMFLFGFCCFFSTIRYLYLFRFNSRLSQFGKTLEYVQKDLLYFALTFLIVFISFLCLFYLLFNAKVLSCSDVYHTIEMLFEMLLLRFNIQDLYQADRFLGPLAFSLFIYFLVFICCTMIISIIYNGFRHIRRQSKLISNQDQNEDVVLFIFMKMKQALGIKQNNQVECQQNKNSLEQLSNKIDQLIIILNKVLIVEYFCYRIHVLSI
jgi:polycystin 1L2